MPPRGRGRGGSRGGGGHKGQRRHFTNLEELEREKEKEERNRQWRAQRGEGNDDESGSGKSSSSSSEEESSSDESGEEGGGGEEQAKAKGVEHLIEVQNPNRVEKKPKKVAELNEIVEEAPQLSRREREELEKQRAKQHYQKMHAAGKTEEARADLARLALIRKQREEQARKKEEELKAKEAERKAKAESINKALGKKT
ncbi:28 kDa heat- and acid-stable phosphoprotein [Rhipicephalus sanguineus]|uniref:28 kDa heat- and acid-stable phosphoprotein n=1 Tax=Rhipicephalus sanguineus TaxID=34632 RepID=UPI001895F6DB|nr:28 kDa heat- and acid-stable phosphoprotein [Rhipicephalus sanguineus]